ncbi:MAG: excisionase family DNA-binding protein, partial [Gammaproteobacteria bacterium]
RQTVYREIAKGRLKSYKVGRRRLISRQAGEEWQRRLEAEAEGGRPQPKRTYGAEARL